MHRECVFCPTLPTWALRGSVQCQSIFERGMMMLSKKFNRHVKTIATTCIVLGAVPLVAWAVQDSLYVVEQFLFIVDAATAHVVPSISLFG